MAGMVFLLIPFGNNLRVQVFPLEVIPSPDTSS